jgi:hypothetical protein
MQNVDRVCEELADSQVISVVRLKVLDGPSGISSEVPGQKPTSYYIGNDCHLESKLPQLLDHGDTRTA